MDITLILVTLLSLALAAVMTTVAWRIAREERRRSDARVAALAFEIHAGGRGSHDEELPLRNDDEPALASGDLFSAAQPSGSSSRLATVVLVGALIVIFAGSVVYVASSFSRTPPPAARSSVAAGSEHTPSHVETANAADAPLELTALTHDRDADRLTVRGIVHNPSSGAEVKDLTAVVFLYNREGGFLASGRAPVRPGALEAGAESPFAVTIPNAADVGRYRVSFRTADRIVPHIDRRDRPVAQAKSPQVKNQ